MADLTEETAERPPLSFGQGEDITTPLDKARAVALTLMTSSAEIHVTTVAEVILEYLDQVSAQVAKLSEGPKHG